MVRLLRKETDYHKHGCKHTYDKEGDAEPIRQDGALAGYYREYAESENDEHEHKHRKAVEYGSCIRMLAVICSFHKMILF